MIIESSYRVVTTKCTRRSSAGLFCLLAVLLAPAGCKRSEPDSAAVLYCSVDESFAKQIIDDYERRTGQRVRLVTDSEAGKTTGLVKRIRLEKERPRADVFWSGEQSQTILLARDGLLAPYDSPAAADIPDEFRDPQHRWTGFALRARVLAYDPQRSPPESLPERWQELSKSPYASGVTLANPLFGTTGGHMAMMRVLWGAERFREYLSNLVEAGAVVADGNSTAVRKVIAGEAELAFTDSDDVLTARRRGHSVEMVFPDMGDGGTMLIPNTVALLAGCPRPQQARRLIDYILSPEVEEKLARSDSGNYPVRSALCRRLGITRPPGSKVAPDLIADAMAPAIADCREILLK